MYCRIRVQGHVDPSWQHRFADLHITHEEGGTTLLSGSLSDQAALQGILLQIVRLGLPLLTLETSQAPGSDEETGKEKGNRTMRKVVLGMQTSLDGYVATPDGKLGWAFANFDPELGASAVESLSQLDTILLGRVNYRDQAATWPHQQGPLADIMNGLNKIVFSSTLQQLDWVNSRLASGPPAEEIARLKQEPGKDIGVAGGARFAQSLSRDGLIDEYRLTVHPVVLGSGLPLFADLARPLSLKLVHEKALGSGVLLLTYERA